MRASGMPSARRIVPFQKEANMSATALQRKVIGYLQDCHAMERQVYHMLNGLVATTSDPEVKQRMTMHRHETERQIRLIYERLVALGSGPARLEDMGAVMTAWMKGFYDMIRADKPGKNARDAYVTEHMEIAAYSLLTRLAERAGDLETVRLARDLEAEERQMSDWIEQHWDKFIDLTLAENRIEPYWASASAGGRQQQQQGMMSSMMPDMSSEGMLKAACWAVGIGAVGYFLYDMTRGNSSSHTQMSSYPSRSRQDMHAYSGM